MAGVVIPLICDENYNIVNGNARYIFYKKKFAKIPCIVAKGITPDIFKYITANYSLKGREDNIRVEARRHFIRPHLSKHHEEIAMGKASGNFPLAFRLNYQNKHYKHTLDFGSGNGKQTAFQRALGQNITMFEPFSTKKLGEFSLLETYTNLSTFLDELEANDIFDMVRANAVLNSVPFEEDLKKVVTLLKFLACGSIKLAVTGRNVRKLVKWEGRGTGTKIKDMGKSVIISISQKTKVQKFHTIEEMVEMFSDEGTGTEALIVDGRSGDIAVEIRYPKYTIGKKELLEAVAFEFGMSYENRVFKDIKKRALQVFEERYDRLLLAGVVQTN